MNKNMGLHKELMMVLICLSVISQLLIGSTVWKSLNGNMEKFIIKEMKAARETLEYDIRQKYFEDDNNTESIDLRRAMNKIKERFGLYVLLENESKERIESGNIQDEEAVKRAKRSSKEKREVFQYKNKGSNVQATYIYPLYMWGGYKFHGSIVFQKTYIEEYNRILQTMIVVIVTQFIGAVMFIILMDMWIRKRLKNLVKLAGAMKEFGSGNKRFDLDVGERGEIGVVINQFIEMQKSIEENIVRLKKQKEKSEELEKKNKELFDYATHEMKTPLTAIEGYVQLLEQEILDQNEKTRAYDRIKVESIRLKKLVIGMLDLAKNNKVKKEKSQEIFINEFIGEIIEEYRIIHRDRLFEYLGGDVWKRVTVVEEDMEKIVRNLLDNAVKYSCTKKITVKVIEDEEIGFYVINECTPIPKEIKSKLFEPFIKYDHGNRNITSSGLGLMIVRELCLENSFQVSLRNCSTKFEVKVVKMIKS